MIVWEDEDIINNGALESEWAAVATATQNLPTDTSVGCSGIKSNQKRIHFAPDVACARTHTHQYHMKFTDTKQGRRSICSTCCFHCLFVYCEKKKKERERKGAKRNTQTHSLCLELVDAKGSITSA